MAAGEAAASEPGGTEQACEVGRSCLLVPATAFIINPVLFFI